MTTERGRQRRLTVRMYVIGGFAVCVAVLTSLVWAASGAASRRERDRAFDQLRAAADGVAAWLDPAASSVEPLLSSMGSDENVMSLDPTRCQPVFDALATGIAGAHLHVLDAAGVEVCGVRPPAEEIDAAPLPWGAWADEAVRTGEMSVSATGKDPLSHRYAVTYALRIGDTGGVIAAVLYVSDPPVEVPGIVGDVRVVVLDERRELVVGGSADATDMIGRAVAGTALAEPVPEGAVVDLDGERRYYQESTVPLVDWTVLAGFDETTALASAHSQRRWMLGIGAAAVVVVLALGLVLVGRVARPLRQFSSALLRSRDGDDDARAPLDGPAELATASALFNELIEDRIAREADLEHRAMHDALTGLRNRFALVAVLDELTGEGRSCAVLFLDLDRFKLVNDVHGHSVGDALLVTLATELERVVGAERLLARFGGDEFVVVCDGVVDAADAASVADAMLRVVCTPHTVEDLELFVTGSIGIALSSPGDTSATLLRNADTAMYRSKASGAGGHCVFDAAMRAWDVERLTVEHDLHRALERGELVIHYQPIFDLNGQSPPRAEALVRWRHPTRGLLQPGDFIEIAEDAGLIGRLGGVVLHGATAFAAAWPELEVSVNVASAQLAGGLLIEQVRSALAASGLEPNRLCVEVTEMGLLEDLDAVAEVLDRVKALGVKVAIDDFGTGWSSLAWLQLLPVDEVKIDRSFVERLEHDAVSIAIVRALADLSSSLGLRIVAEGVETQAQLIAVRSFGIEAAQGFLLGRPRPAEELRAELEPLVAQRRAAI